MRDPLQLALQDLKARVFANVVLAPRTHVRIGGPAEWLVEPLTESAVQQLVRVCRELGRPLRVLGGGSNLLIDDAGVRGVVMELGALNRVVRDGDRLTAGAGTSLPTLLRGARESGLAGLEILTGIPAQVGGAVAMNAGTRDGETFDLLASLTVVEPTGELRVLGRPDFAPRYRDGGLAGRICVHATFDLQPDDPKRIYQRFRDSLERRNATQPVTERSVGCVFRNPGEDSAGRLIERAGCKLMRVGGIQVSGRHANYFVNDGTGTCAEFLKLVELVRDRVRREFGVELELEVVRWTAG
ncbi:MAG: UDP-N-acetylmuramate dehydrogenase [Planctomycetes bacterium]|nr:UDP-N-acetylmuramate dehydrogenase [Planctomycetota bacterium]